MDDQDEPTAPPLVPPMPPLDAPPAPQRSAANRIIGAFLTLLVVFVLAVGTWGFVHHPGYDQFLPGDALAVEPRITVHGAATYKAGGDVYLLFVRQRSDLNEWQYLWAKTFPGDSDIAPSPPGSQASNDQQDLCDMTDSKATAEQVALQRLGYKLTAKPGVLVQQILDSSFPAASVLRCNDIVHSVDGHATETADALRLAISKHKGGDTIDLGIDRGNRRVTIPVKLVSIQGQTLIGVGIAERYVLPVTLSIDTEDIAGPSAGLAMTLALLDQLTPGSLTGGKKVAVTGTISPNGAVGEIGEIRLKAIAARRRGVQLFLVPACDPQDSAQQLQACKADLVKAEKEAKGVKVVPVRNVDEALRALAANGGDPLPAAPKSR